MSFLIAKHLELNAKYLRMWGRKLLRFYNFMHRFTPQRLKGKDLKALVFDLMPKGNLDNCLDFLRIVCSEKQETYLLEKAVDC